MELQHMTFTTGYIGSLGKSWKTPTQADLDKAINGAMIIEGKTREQIIAILDAGKAVRWCQSPNYYYDHTYGVIGRKRETPSVEMVRCDCGHDVPRIQCMSASLGSSCPDCYDRMSV